MLFHTLGNELKDCRAFFNIVQLTLLRPLKIVTYNLFNLNLVP